MDTSTLRVRARRRRRTARITPLLTIVFALAAWYAPVAAFAAELTVSLHPDHVGADSETFRTENDDRCSEDDDQVGWHFVLNGVNVVDEASSTPTLTATFESAGTIVVEGEPSGDGDGDGAWHFCVLTDSHDTLLGAVATFDGTEKPGGTRLVLSHVEIGANAPPQPEPEPGPEPEPEPDVVTPTAELSFDCTSGVVVTATNPGDAVIELTVLQDGQLIDTIEVPANTTTATPFPVDGETLAEDATATFTVRSGNTVLDERSLTRDCDAGGGGGGGGQQANPAAELSFDCTSGVVVTATNTGTADATLSVFQDGQLIDTITVPAGTATATEFEVDGETLAEDTTATFMVKSGDTVLDSEQLTRDCQTTTGGGAGGNGGPPPPPPPPPPPGPPSVTPVTEVCIANLIVEIREVDTGELVGGGMIDVPDMGGITILPDGDVTFRDLVCDTFTVTRVEAPTGFDFVGDDDSERVDLSDGGTETVVFLVDETEVLGIVEECVGGLVVSVVDENGIPVPDSSVVIDGREVSLPTGSTTLPDLECGELVVELGDIPPGTQPVGATTEVAEIRDEELAEVVFVIEQPQVLRDVREAPPAPDAAPAPPAPEPVAAPAELPRTGIDGASTLLAALFVFALGGLLLAAGRRPSVAPVAIRWTRSADRATSFSTWTAGTRRAGGSWRPVRRRT